MHPDPDSSSAAVGRTRLRILFVLRHNGYVRNWEWVIRELLRRGHRIHVGVEMAGERRDVVEQLAREYPEMTHGQISVRTDRYVRLAEAAAGTVDYLRYLSPAYRDAPKLRKRAGRRVPKPVRRLVDHPRLGTPAVVRTVNWAGRRLENAIPGHAAAEQLIIAGKYDVIMATPLVSSTVEHEYLRAARRLGRFTVLPVTSWDNLTNKGLVRVLTDRVYVWNEAQRAEAIELHGLPASRVVTVGAHTYDHWFDWRESGSRQAFCDEVGLDPMQPYLLYTCSSKFIAADERPIIRSWVEALRRRPELREVGVLVRPHPQIGLSWEETGLEDLKAVVVWPRRGADPRTHETRAAYYDSLTHSAAVVGINTSALIEAAIVGRQTYTVLLPETRDTQEGTLHFQHLLRENGGPLTVAKTMDEHVDQLRSALANPLAEADATRVFVREFIRPHGLDARCAPILADDLERAVTEERLAPMPLPGTVDRALAALAASVAGVRRPRVFQWPSMPSSRLPRLHSPLAGLRGQKRTRTPRDLVRMLQRRVATQVKGRRKRFRRWRRRNVGRALAAVARSTPQPLKTRLRQHLNRTRSTSSPEAQIAGDVSAELTERDGGTGP